MLVTTSNDTRVDSKPRQVLKSALCTGINKSRNDLKETLPTIIETQFERDFRNAIETQNAFKLSSRYSP